MLRAMTRKARGNDVGINMRCANPGECASRRSRSLRPGSDRSTEKGAGTGLNVPCRTVYTFKACAAANFCELVQALPSVISWTDEDRLAHARAGFAISILPGKQPGGGRVDDGPVWGLCSTVCQRQIPLTTTVWTLTNGSCQRRQPSRLFRIFLSIGLGDIHTVEWESFTPLVG